MGQRTQLIVKVNETRYNGEKRTITGTYHNQWGFARMQLFDIINLLNTYINGTWEMPKQLAKGFLEDEKYSCKDLTINGVTNYLNNYADNNNGGAFIELNVERYQIVSGKLVLFSDPESESSMLSNGESILNARPFMSYKKYKSFNEQYFTKEFDRMFLSTLKYYNVKIITKAKDLA